jgi:phytoene synthase
MKAILEEAIFKNGSTTYFWSSKFFPKGVRDDVYKLYSFVRVVDDLVDADIPDEASFKHIEKRWKSAKKNLSTGFQKQDSSTLEQVVSNIAYIVHRYECDPAWVDAFLRSMRMDLARRRYATMDDTLEYIYGSAEVIGLMMAKIMRLPEKAYESAKLQGRAMQYINFIRDIQEDNGLGRQYFPDDELLMFGLKNVSEKECTRKPAEFREFIEAQIAHYNTWQKEANSGHRYIPRRMRVAVKTACDMYNWTAKVLADDPKCIFEKKVKPSKGRVVRTGLKRSLYA